MIIVITILFIHFITDFLFQSDWMAQNKSSNNNALLLHTTIYSCCWIFMRVFLGFYQTIIFVFVTFVMHTLTDYFTSRFNSKLWKEKKVHYFFVSVGFDQLCHYVQLLVTYQILK